MTRTEQGVRCCALYAALCLGILSSSTVAQESGTGRIVAGKPLSYWIGQATSASRTEEVGRVVEALAEAVADGDATAKVAAADTLATLGVAAKPALPVLLEQLTQELAWIRASAAGAARAMGKDAVPALIELFEKQQGGDSVRAAFILGSIGADAKSAIPSMVRIMNASNEVMRVRYANILNQIDPIQFPGNRTRPTLQAGRVQLGDDDLGFEHGGLSRDWSQFHGPNRDSVCRDRGLLQAWPEGGPALLWVKEGLGMAYSSVSMAGGRIITMGDRPVPGGEKAQFALAFDVNTRAELWATRVGGPFKDGPRCTPTVVGDLVYVLSTEGTLFCLEAATGKIRWQKSLPEDLDGKMMSRWQYCESPLVDGDRIICTPGGPETALVALDRHTGNLIWKCTLPSLGEKGADGAGYASAVVADIQGVRQVVQIMGRGVVGVDAATGKFLWGYNRIACNVANITGPVVRGNYVFVTTAYNTGSALLEITRSGDTFGVQELYFLAGRDFQNHHGGVVLADGYLYGGRGGNSGHPTCIDLATGKICWSERSPSRGSASVVYADGHLIFRYDRGEVILLEATPEAMRIKGRFTPVKGQGPAWAHPAIHQGRLYLRHGDKLACYDLRAVN